jgi:molybdopterin molybdotransferase
VRDAIWAAWDDDAPVYLRNRTVAVGWMTQALSRARDDGVRVLVGCDFAFAYPAGFAARVTGDADPLGLWDWLAEALPVDAPPAARFDLAGRLNGLFGCGGPFWGNGLHRDVPDLPRRRPAWRADWPAERRPVETRTPGTFAQWQLAGVGSVGSQTLTGLPVLSRLRRRFGPDLTVWPFQPPTGRIVLAEVWPSLIGDAVRAIADPIPDRAQVRLLSRTLAALPPGGLPSLLDHPADPEGWILGAGHETLIRDTAMPLAVGMTAT